MILFGRKKEEEEDVVLVGDRLGAFAHLGSYANSIAKKEIFSNKTISLSLHVRLGRQLSLFPAFLKE